MHRQSRTYFPFLLVVYFYKNNIPHDLYPHENRIQAFHIKDKMTLPVFRIYDIDPQIS